MKPAAVGAYHQSLAPDDRSICELQRAEIDTSSLAAWLAEARDIQWDYKNVVKRKGRLERIALS